MSENLKRCSKCGEEKGPEEFHKNKAAKSGRVSICKDCCRLKAAEYYQDNKEDVKERSSKHYYENRSDILQKNREKYANMSPEERESHQESGRKWREANKEEIRETSSKYYQDNKEEIKENSSKYYYDNTKACLRASTAYSKKNPEAAKLAKKKYWHTHGNRLKGESNSPLTIESYVDKIPSIDKAKFLNGVVTVLCVKCGNRFAPTANAIRNRVRIFNGDTGGESNFYCSEVCKDSCVLFRFRADRLDPRSKLYEEKDTKARNCQTDHLKQLQCDEVGYNYCEKCGDIIDVELHHTQTLESKSNSVITSAGHMLLCVGCHIKLHAECKGGE